ncbi:hypothetical protein [Microcystis aeruginosa]|uniref:hypothetical protein n=1 Tax=Microcystis aeruginosa TaxID=1126 RepID=UPI00232A9351|nr:hypothetical protein [Microcystis aeruginosa]MDB9415666.1 hypothetical protein [Microcystis aeruginosa CS-556/03]
MISLTYIGAINLCVPCVLVVRSICSPARMYFRIHFTHQTQESKMPATNKGKYYDYCLLITVH